MNFIEVPDVLSINGNRLLVRRYFEEFHSRKKKTIHQAKNESNLNNNYPSGLINRKIRAKMKTIIVNWIEALQHSPYNDKGHKIQYPTFVTLTLPSKQIHTDKELHQKALNRYITQLKRSYQVEQYLWRAERQQNGNIHYHIIIDKYVHYKAIRYQWNKIMQDLGYIDNYRKEQQEHHKNGFQLREGLSKYWTAERQYEAYKKGIECNWSDPNSTDIHKLSNIKNVSDYICKYATKCEETTTLDQLKKAQAQGTITTQEYEQQLSALNAIIEANKIKGRVWGCSDSLRNMQDVKIIVTSTVDDLITAATKDPTSKVISDPNYQIIYCRNLKKYINSNRFITSEVRQHQQNNFYHLYPHHKPKPIPIKNHFIDAWKPMDERQLEAQALTLF
jgi:hypothetical protein